MRWELHVHWKECSKWNRNRINKGIVEGIQKDRASGSGRGEWVDRTGYDLEVR